MGYAKTAPWRSKAGNVGSKSLDTGHGSNWKQLVILDLGKLKKQLLEYVWGWIPHLIIIYHHSIGNYWWGPCEMSMILGHPQQAGYDWEPWKIVYVTTWPLVSSACKRLGKHACLIGGSATPLKNMKVNWDDELPNIWENKKCSKPPTSMFDWHGRLWEDLLETGNVWSYGLRHNSQTAGGFVKWGP